MRRLVLLAALSLAACEEEGRTLREALRPEPALTDEEVRGRELAERHGCGTCHVIPGIEGANGLTGPPLDAMPRNGYVAGVLPNTPEAVARFIMDPQSVDPRSAMPRLGIARDEATAITAFLYAVGEEP